MAARSKRLKSNAANYPIPANRAEADAFIRRIGEAQRTRTRVEAEMNDELARIKANYEEVAKPHKEEIESLKKGL